MTRVRSAQETFIGIDALDQGLEYAQNAQAAGWQFVERNVEGSGADLRCTIYLQWTGEPQDQSALAEYKGAPVPPRYDEDGVNQNGYTEWEQWVVDTIGELQKDLGEAIRVLRDVQALRRPVEGELVFEPGISPAPRPWNRT
jgi:hypothetical protein